MTNKQPVDEQDKEHYLLVMFLNASYNILLIVSLPYPAWRQWLLGSGSCFNGESLPVWSPLLQAPWAAGGLLLLPGKRSLPHPDTDKWSPFISYTFKLKLACHFYEGMHWLQYPPLKRILGQQWPFRQIPCHWSAMHLTAQEEEEEEDASCPAQPAPPSRAQGHDVQPMFIGVSWFSVQRRAHKCSDGGRLFLPAVVELHSALIKDWLTLISRFLSAFPGTGRAAQSCAA